MYIYILISSINNNYKTLFSQLLGLIIVEFYTSYVLGSQSGVAVDQPVQGKYIEIISAPRTGKLLHQYKVWTFPRSKNRDNSVKYKQAVDGGRVVYTSCII